MTEEEDAIVRLACQGDAKALLGFAWQSRIWPQRLRLIVRAAAAARSSSEREVMVATAERVTRSLWRRLVLILATLLPVTLVVLYVDRAHILENLAMLGVLFSASWLFYMRPYDRS